MHSDGGAAVDNCDQGGWPGPWDHRHNALESELRRTPAGISEFDLIRRLQAREDVPEITRDSLRTPLALYRTHFLLFHTLYRLGERLAPQGEDVVVHCLGVRIVPRRTEAGLAAPDAMRGFYADRDNLDGISEADVERLLGDFWRRFTMNDERDEALATLGLSDPVSDADIKAAYRRLAMRHHPDRGGDGERLREIHEAVRVLGV